MNLKTDRKATGIAGGASLGRPTGSLPIALVIFLILLPSALDASEDPYFVTYSHHLEEPGNLEIAMNPLLARPSDGKSSFGSWMEFEYGTKAWWTTEFYLEGQSTHREGTLFTGYRIENRFRPLMENHWINPVLYFEFEHLNGASKTLQEVVGFDSQEDLRQPLAQTRREKEKEMELRLVLGSDFKGWNLSENFIAEKNLSNAPWEFGYAIGLNRPLRLSASALPCTFCRENFRLGAEIYGGLGDWHRLTFNSTAHYVAPVVLWELNRGVTAKISPGFGLTGSSVPFLFRFGISFEIPGFGQRARQLFRQH